MRRQVQHRWQVPVESGSVAGFQDAAQPAHARDRAIARENRGSTRIVVGSVAKVVSTHPPGA